MFIVLGATGHIGSAVVSALLEDAKPVTAVTRDAHKAAQWRARGAQTAVVDIRDTDALRDIFRRGKRAYLLNPPAPVSTDTDKEERQTIASIVRALDDSGLEMIVAASTYGAQPCNRCGDLGTLHTFEQSLGALVIPCIVLRASYYMSNWDALLDAARAGEMPTFLPANLRIPMVAPADVGRAAAGLLLGAVSASRIHYIEGPEHYCPNDVAAAFAAALGHSVVARALPRQQWMDAYRALGFSDAAAESYERMTAISVEGGFDTPDNPQRGSTTIAQYIGALVNR